MSDIDYKFAHVLILKHSEAMEKAGTPLACPVCRNEELHFTGVESSPSRTAGRGSVPVAVAVCSNCLFKLTFAWHGLVARYTVGGEK